ncbi:zinc finger, CCHC-type containing protein [Tanacetum coccineum]
MSVRQVWKRKTPLPKSSPTCHNDSPPPPPTNTPHSISPPMNYPQRDRIINQLHTISTLIDSQTPTPPSSPHPLVPPPTNAQVGCHASFCHCCRCKTKRITNVNMKFCRFKKLRIGFLYGSRGMRPLAGSRGRAPCWGPAARSAGMGRGAAPRWGLRAMKKMHFLLTTLMVVYVLTTPMPKLLEDATVEAIRIRAKWENDDYICKGHILNGMSDSLFDVYTNVESAKELWDSLESKYMAEDSSSKKFLDLKHTLKHGIDDLSLVQLSSHLRIEESLRAQDSDKGNGKEVAGPSVNMTEEGKNKNNKQNKGKKRGFNENNSGSGSNKKPKLECWKCGKTSHFKRDCRSGKKKNVDRNITIFNLYILFMFW